MQNRIPYVGSFLLVVVLGLLSRHPVVASFVPYAVGDALYAVMIYLGLGLVWPNMLPWRRAVFALLVCVGIECSQLLDWPWLQQLRANKVARLVLGQGFLWSDLLAYSLGILLVFAINLRSIRK